MRANSHWRGAVLTAIVLLVPGSSAATPIAYGYSGIIDSAELSADAFGLPGDVVFAGASFTGTFLYDTDTPAGDPGTTQNFYLHGAGDIRDWTIRFSSNVALNLPADGTLRVRIANGIVSGQQEKDVFSLSSGSIPDVSGLVIREAILTLEDTDASVFSSSALPSALSISDFELAQISLLAMKSVTGGPSPRPSFDSDTIKGSITSLHPIPEPGTAGLLLLGLIALSWLQYAPTLVWGASPHPPG